MGNETDGTSKFIAGQEKRRYTDMGVAQKRSLSTRNRQEAS